MNIDIKNKNTWLILLGMSVLVVLGSYYGLYQDKIFEQKKVNIENVTIGFTSELNYLPLIAIEQGFFEDEGLNIKVVSYPTGQRTLRDGLIGKQIDIGIVGLGPYVFESFTRNDIKIFGSVSTFFNVYKILVNTNSRIKSHVDLIGKKVATTRDSTFHFFLDYFLLENNMLEENIKLSFELDNNIILDMFKAGKTDAIVSREPFVSQIKKERGDDVVVFSEPGLFLNTLNLLAFDDFIKNNPSIIEKILKSLIRAEDFVRDHPDESIKFLASKLNIEEEILMNTWEENDLTLSLDKELILNMENFARWAVENNFADSETIPNYLGYIYTDALRSLRPEKVNIISTQKIR